MNQANGVVLNIYPEQRTSRAGKSFTIWKVELDTGEVFENGFDQPTFQIGDSVAFSWEMKYGKPTISNGNTAGGAANSSGNKAQGAGNKQYGGKGNYTPKPFPLPKNHGDTSIIRQNALTNARELVVAMGISDQENTDQVIERVIDIAYAFAEFSSGQREERIAKEMMNQPIGNKPQE